MKEKKSMEYKITRTTNVHGEFKWKIVWNDGFSPDDKWDSFKEADDAAKDYIKTYRGNT